MRLSVLLFAGLLFRLGASAQTTCKHFVPINQIVSSPEGVLTIDDEAGARQIKATIFNTPDCDVNAAAPTGSVFSGNSNVTTIGQAGSQSNSCEIKNVGGVQTIDSFQAIVIEANGWPMNGVTLKYGDIDASDSSLWREAAVVFGLHNGALVAPNIQLESDTLLRLSNYNVPATSMFLLGLTLGSVTVQSVEYGSTTLFNCPFDESDIAKRCNAKISFSSEVDTIVIMYAVLSRGTLASRSGALLSEITMDCGCRCRETNPGTRQIAAPVPGVSGQCTRKDSSGPKVECDVLGSKWCLRKSVIEYGLTGTTLPNGNLECQERSNFKAVLYSDFSPNSAFGGTN